MVQSGSTAQKQVVHTERHFPIEVVIGRIVAYVFGAIDLLLAMRFVLLLLGANRASGFVQFIYSFSAIFMAPFTAIFKTQRAAGATLEWSVIVAIAVYALVGWGIVALVDAVSPRRSSETVERVEESENTAPRQ